MPKLDAAALHGQSVRPAEALRCAEAAARDLAAFEAEPGEAEAADTGASGGRYGDEVGAGTRTRRRVGGGGGHDSIDRRNQRLRGMDR